MSEIEPTVGRVVHYYPSDDDHPHFYVGDPHAAIITEVHSNRMVNIVAFGSTGESHGMTSVDLVQPGDDTPDGGHYCAWMPYQVGQAERTKQAEQGSI